MNRYDSTLPERGYDRTPHREYEIDPAESLEQDREISLGATTILGIFFGLALVCSLFFGLGYSMGRRTATPVAAAVETPAATDSSATKPLSGSLAEKSIDASVSAPAAPPSVAVVPLAAPAARNFASTEKPAAKPAPAPAATATAGTIMVQIAAVSHREDADTLLSTLKQRGYDVFIRNEPQDKLLHVQVGPFASHKDAETMKQRLLADGYNAILK